MSVYRTSKSMRFLFFPQYKVSFRVCLCARATQAEKERQWECEKESVCLCGRATRKKEHFLMYEI